MRSSSVWLSLVLLLMCPAVGAEEAPHVTLQGARVSVNAQDAPLKRILAEISRVSGIQISLESTGDADLADQATTVAFQGLTIEEAMRRLLRETNYTFVYSAAGLVEVRVYGGAQAAEPGMETKQRRADLATAPGVGPAGADPDDPDRFAWLRSQSLRGAEPRKRSVALEELAAHDPHLAVETALEVLDVEHDHGVLASALDLLDGHQQWPLERVLRVATSNHAPPVRARALELIAGRHRDEPTVKHVLRTLAKTDTDPRIRETAATLLRELGPR